MKIVFRTDASIEIGTGHVRRCLTLAESFSEQGYQCEFVCRAHVGNLIEHIESLGFKCHQLKRPTNDEGQLSGYEKWLGLPVARDAMETREVLDQTFDLLVVDHYSLDHKWESEFRGNAKNILVIDDLANRRHDCDFLLDQTFGRSAKEYQSLVPHDCRCLLGSRYALIRREFSVYREQSIERRKKRCLKKILISMGGVDKDNMTERALCQVFNSCLPLGVNIIVAMGRNSPWIDSVKQRLSLSPYPSSVIVEPQNMAKVMMECDFAIGAAGSSTWERCCLGLPSILTVIAQNQKYLASQLGNNNSALVADLTVNTDSAITKYIDLIISGHVDLNLLSMNCAKITDGLGAKDVVRSIALEI